MKEQSMRRDLISFRVVYIVLSFVFIDLWLRFLTKDIGFYNIMEGAPNFFTLFWALIIVNIIFLISKKNVGRVVYGLLYFIYSIYAVVQYGYYLIFGKFLFFSDFLFAGEGSDYFSYIIEILSVPVVIAVILLFAVGVLGIIIYPEIILRSKEKLRKQIIIFVIFVCGIFFTPNFYNNQVNAEDVYLDASYEYERFTNSSYDMQLTGLYQYIAKDGWKNIKNYFDIRTKSDVAIEKIQCFFDEKNSSDSNDMTGVFEGKNIIIVMMESIDDWVVTEDDMPTVHYMMEHGINFTNMYTPNYSSGYTINTEFAFNTSCYPLSTENFVYTLTGNNFDYSISNVFKKSGYEVNSFHYNTADFYNREELHSALGYKEYYSYFDYSDDLVAVSDDSFICTCDELYDKLTNAGSDEKDKFMSFVITVSAHLSYSPKDWMGQIAMEKYPQYAEGEVTEEDVLRAKARLTDDMFANLLKRLEEDGILEDTVIVGFTDHYSYGITDEELLQHLSNEAGNSILENTPAFIYCAGVEDGIIVDKVAQITDLAPTIENLFGLDVPKEIMGNDIFNDQYEGYAIFPNYTWITNNTYLKNGKIVYNNGMSDSDITKMMQLVQRMYLVNDYILEYDYYNIQTK